MLIKTDKRTRALAFRTRLQTAMTAANATQSGLARTIGVDRSTVSQLLSDDGARLPNAHVVGACASALGVSSDWLLSLSDRPETAAAMMAADLAFTKAPRAMVDEQIFDWHKEAAGYKIRHVPAALPDMLKTDALLRWEYAPHFGKTAEQAINASKDRLTWMRNSDSDYEIVMPIFELESFASGTGYYDSLPRDIRLGQLEYMSSLIDQLYPRMRLYLYDARKLYSAPLTVFGPLLCVLYAGSHYLAFRDKERIATLTAHFDTLVREAAASTKEVAARIDRHKADLDAR